MRKFAVFTAIIVTLSFCVCFSSCSSPSAVVSFSVNGEIVHSQTVTESSGFEEFVPPLEDGFLFGGWFTDETFSSPFSFHMYVSRGSFEDITVYALISPVEDTPSGDDISPSEDMLACVHDPVFVPAAEPTCTRQGNSAYWKCSLCDNIFSDESCSAFVHPFIDALGHSASFVFAKSASCTQDGFAEHWFCSRCNTSFEDEACSVELSNSVISKYGHSPVFCPATASTCTSHGVKEHWICSACNCLLTHPEDTIPVSPSSLAAPLLPHDFSSFSVSSPPTKTDAGALLLSCACGATCVYPVPALSENDYFVDVELETCSKYGFESYTLKDFDYPAHIVLTLPRHSPSLSEPHGARPATCSEEGFTGTIVCTECGETVSEGETVPKLEHDYVVTDSLSPTCTCRGYITYACSRCEDHYTKSLPLAEHGFTLVSETPSSCVSTGIAEHYVCSGCGEIFDMQKQPCSFQDLALPLGEHVFVPVPEKPSSCSSTGVAEHYSCSVCTTLFDYTKHPCSLQDLVIPLAQHSFDDSGICSVCKTADIPDGAVFTENPSGYTFCLSEPLSVTELVVPSSYKGKPVTQIDALAFSYCPDLISLRLPNSLSSLPDNILSPLKNLQHLSIPFAGTSRDGDSTLLDLFGSRSLSLSSVTVTDAPSIPDDAFPFVSLSEIRIAEGCTSIGKRAFSSCAYLNALHLPSSLTSVSSDALRGAFRAADNPRIFFSGSKTQWYSLAANFTLPDNVEVCFETKPVRS